MANEFIARNGLIAQNNSVVTGSLIVTQGITGSLLGTASYAEAARTVGITELDSVPVNFNITFAGASSGDSSLHVDTTALTYNPNTSTFTTPIISATSITASLFGTASFATTASYSISSSYATTASYALSAGTDFGIIQAFSVGLQNIF